jgi:hypothetical protein
MAFRTNEERREVRQRRIMRLRRRLGIRVFVTAFVCWHLFAIAIYSMPNTNPLVGQFLDSATTYLTGISCLQGWGTFAANPNTTDVAAEADITYMNGQVRDWRFPRPADMPNHWTAYNKERWHEYLTVINNDEDAGIYLWPSMAKYAARVNYTDTNNPPVSVELVKYVAEIAPLGQDQPPPQRISFHTESIGPEDLK